MTVPNAQSDGELLESMLTGDAEALSTLYRRRHVGVYRFALQMSGSQALAEDVTQEVFVALLADSASYDPTRGSVNAFLLGIARNHVLRRLDRDRFYVPIDENHEQEVPAKDGPPAAEDPLDNLSRNETVELVRKAVLSLPARYREVVVLCDLQEMSYAEAAAVLGCAIGTVRSRLHRARALLIEKLRLASEGSPASATVKPTRCFA
jgi:RNA polymerase sigma-70 factor, ECF subfamily